MLNGGRITNSILATMVDMGGYVTPTFLERSGLLKKRNWRLFNNDKIYESEDGQIQFRFSSSYRVTLTVMGVIMHEGDRLDKDESSILLKSALRDLRIKNILK